MEISIKKATSKLVNYENIIEQIKSLEDVHPLSLLSSCIALLYNYIDKVSWAGIYLYDNDTNQLYVGPYQGNIACLNIIMGMGVCGAVAMLKKTKIVKDVRKEKNHIYCDEKTLSEIVVPILKNEMIIGVIDIDSYTVNNFDEIDQYYLEKISKIISLKY